MCYAEIGEHMSKHGDGVKDVAFAVEDLDAIFKVFQVVLFDKLLTLCLLVCTSMLS